MTSTLVVSVVGHANSGKTSLMRTLLRNNQFGQVQNFSGTTRHVESAVIQLTNGEQIELVDTPGLEDSSALKLELDSHKGEYETGSSAYEAFISEAVQHPEFEQEIKVLKQALQSDVLMYVIDCREPILAKYIDEIQILQMAARPILPVINFLHHSDSTLADWQKTLPELGLHARVAFDTVAFDFDAEKRLYQKMQTLQESHYDLIQHLIEQRENDWQNLHLTACKRVAHLLFDAANLSTQSASLRGSSQTGERSLMQLQNMLIQKERQCLNDLLDLMQFSETDVVMAELPVSNGQWQLDLFSPETLKALGLDTASAAATGAAIGVGVDLVFAGMSLGAATATGAALGAAWHTSKKFGKNLFNKISGREAQLVDDATLDLLFLRQLWLLNILFHRGHATTEAAQLQNKPNIKVPQDWPKQRSRTRASSMGWGEDETQFIKQLGLWISQIKHQA